MSAVAPPTAASAKSPAARDNQRIYSIAELSREFAITPRTIRFYEDEGLIKPRRQGMTRLYSAGDRTRLGWILRGKRLGFALAEIRDLLDLYQVDRTGVQQLRELLRRSRLHIGDLEWGILPASAPRPPLRAPRYGAGRPGARPRREHRETRSDRRAGRGSPRAALLGPAPRQFRAPRRTRAAPR